ncbi:hypothetical protein MJO28_009507 [Puccinia striiformis f. sp. tritici]|uniref:Uncharacterized protein n=1 Tax=Puccinia striiformis f. sp. tritici TaxID=168172 RepID=A0ACC0E9A2_9BASI|nr:hypothetical protein MJO28_009507 [Puccinia striiformis f. sp. tritici]
MPGLTQQSKLCLKLDTCRSILSTLVQKQQRPQLLFFSLPPSQVCFVLTQAVLPNRLTYQSAHHPSSSLLLIHHDLSYLKDPESVVEALKKLPLQDQYWPLRLQLLISQCLCTTDPILTSTPNSQPSNLRPVSQAFPNLTSPTNIPGENAPTTYPRLGSSPLTNGSGLPNNLPTVAQLSTSYFSGLTAYGRINLIQNILQAQFTVVKRLDSIRRQLHNQHLKLLGINNHPLSENSIIDPIQAEQSIKEWKRIEGKLVNLLADLKFPASYTAFPGSVPPEPLQTEFDPLLPDEGSVFKRYKQLERELNPTLPLEAQSQYLVLQAQKTQANLNQMDGIISAGFRLPNTLGGDREAQQVQRIFDGLFPPDAFPFLRPPPGHGDGAGGL